MAPFENVIELCPWSTDSISSECPSMELSCITLDELGSPASFTLNELGSSAPSGDLKRRICGKCHRCFDNAYSLEKHAKTSGHRIYDCKVPGCDRSYCRRDLLTRHRKSHELGHICHICQENQELRTFKRRDHLLQHFRNRHQGVSLPLAKEQAQMSKTSGSGSGLKSKCSCSCDQKAGSAGTIDSLESERNERSTSSSRTSSVVTEYKSPVIQDLDLELIKQFGDPAQLQSMRESLELSKDSTTEGLVRKISQLVQRQSRTE